MKVLALLVLLTLCLMACATKDGYRHPAGVPTISYSQTKVVVILPYNDNNNTAANQILYLNSNVHGKKIRSARVVPNTNENINTQNKNLNNTIFSQPKLNQPLIIKQPAWYNPPNAARFDLPTSAPAHQENVCFYITNQDGQVIPARVTPSYQSGSLNDAPTNQKGFTNPIWQQTFGNPAMQRGTSNSISNVMQELAVLKQKISEATHYVNRGDIIENSQCLVPPHSGSEPTPPFSNEYLSQRKFMPISMCLQADQRQPSVTAKLKVVNKNVQSLVLENLNDISKATNFISKKLNQGQSPEAFPKVVKEVFANKQYGRSCYGDNCRYERKLYEDSLYRIYSDNFDKCVTKIAEEIGRVQTSFQQRLHAWQVEPQQRYQLCETQLTLFNTKDQQVKKLENRKAQLEAQLAKLQSTQIKKVEQYQRFTEAYHTPCSMVGN